MGAAVGRKRRWSSVLSGLALLAGSALTRFAVFDAGIASANDPAHIVVPQRERIRRREEAVQPGTTPPADVASLRLLHGSCFSLKGDGQSIMGALDDIISDALPADATAQKQRPHLLLLTGDQIGGEVKEAALEGVKNAFREEIKAQLAPYFPKPVVQEAAPVAEDQPKTGKEKRRKRRKN